MRLLMLGIALVACVAAAALPSAAVAATAPPGPLIVTSGAGDAPQQLVPGATFLWPIEVTAEVHRLDSLMGGLSVQGGLARADGITAEVVSCLVPWAADRCTSGEHTVLAATPLDRLPQPSAALQGGSPPQPGTTFVEVRIRVASDARIPDDATMTAALKIDASGPDGVTSTEEPTLSVSSLADIGGSAPGYAALAGAAIAAGLLIAGASRLAKRVRRPH